MENIFMAIKEKIKFYEEQLSKGNIVQDLSNVTKIEEEIEKFKSKVAELNKGMESKTKIERMKVSLNITSIESEIALKEAELDEERKKAEAERQKKVQDYNNELEASKERLITFIKNSETLVENAIKENEGNIDIVLNKDFEEIKGYYQNIMSVERNTFENIEKEMDNLNEIIDSTEKEIEKIMSEVRSRRIDISYWLTERPTTFFGNFDEDKAEEYQDNAREASRRVDYLLKKVTPMREELEEKKKEKEKLTIKENMAKTKIENIDLMADEMIRELIREEVTKNEITFPSFVPNGKYFNSIEEEIK